MDTKLQSIVVSVGTLVLIAIICATALPTDKLKHYYGYQVIRASPKTPAHYQTIHELIAQDRYDFWREPLRSGGGPADIMLSPTEYPEVTKILENSGIPLHTMIPDLENLLQTERQRKLAQIPHNGDMDWENYHTFDEVNTWLSNLVAGSVNGLITSERYGTSLEGRQLMVYRVSSGSGTGNRTKSAFWIDANIHAREHITSAVITWMINELVSNSGKYEDILENVDFYFAPFLNPDGFVYSHEVDRMWRKTRSNWGNFTCVGVDANRNFGFHWGEAGASDDPCSSGYHGPEPFSEPEARFMRNYILGKAANVSWESYISLHSYSQLWLTPWGYTAEPPEDDQEVLQVATDAAEELKRHFNTSYTLGSFGGALYLGSGTSQDWAKGEGGFKYSYTVELRDTGRYGFLLPPEQIVDTSVETWAGVQVVAKEMIRRRMERK